MDEPDDDETTVTPLDQGPEIPNPIPIKATLARCALELLTEDEIQQAIARGDAQWQETARRCREALKNQQPPESERDQT